MRKAAPYVKAAGGLAGLLMAASLWAGPTLSDWEIRSGNASESLTVLWSEPGEYTLEEYPSARQIVLTIPEAELPQRGLPEPQSSPALKSTKIQRITLVDGREALRMTVTFDGWRTVRTRATAQGITMTYPVLETASPAPPAPQATGAQEPILLSNADIEALKADRYGSSKAPQSGAGQTLGADGADDAADINSPFYIPPDLTREEKMQQRRMDLGTMATEEALSRRVDLEFRDAELTNVIRIIAEKLRLNIILSPDQVGGRVTLKLRDVELRNALEAILKANELAYKVEPGGIVRIVSRDSVKARDVETVTQSIPINWIDSGELLSILEPFLSSNGVIQAADKSNIIIVEDVPEKVTEVQRLIERLDIPEKQVRMELRLVDMTETARRALGFRTNLTEQSDNIALVPLEFTDGGQQGIPGDVEPGDEFLIPQVVSSMGALSGGNALTVQHLNDLSIFGNEYLLDVSLDAQEDRGEAQTLASPTILSLNNVPALIEIKRQVPYLDARNTTQGSVAEVKFAGIGTRVGLTPQITNNGYVQMLVDTEQKILNGFSTLSGNGNVPVVDERFANTAVIVKDEQVVALGGLRQFEANNSETGVPWLLRVPVISWAFKNQVSDQIKTDLFLFIRPSIIKDPNPSAHEMAMYEKIDYNWDLPDYFFDQETLRDSPGELDDPRVKYY
ncbi:MAG: secretin N-terminal domain-containing protein [Sumerlaeia bacterium]